MMMNEKERIARKLAAITGRPVSEFFNGTIKEEERSGNEIKSEPVLHAEEIGSNTEQSTSDKETIPKIEESNEVTEELLELQKLFTGSRVVKDKILGGRQMTKKEYNKYTKGLTLEEYYGHPLMYKMFRAEGQLDPSFMTFPERFR